MAYAAVTPAAFKVAKPQFVGVDDVLVQVYLDMAGRAADGSWDEEDYTNGVVAFACHLMTIDGKGTDAESRSHGKGMAEMQTIKSADLTLVRFQRAAGSSTMYQDWLASTACGKYYLMLLKLNRGGPRVVTGGCGAFSGYAKDATGWPLVFYA